MRKPTAHKIDKVTSIVDVLPQDIIVEILAKVAASCPRPLSKLKSLRQMCKRFYEASKVRKVGLSMNVQWCDQDRDGYFALLTNCARVGNLEASCILGLEQVHNKGMKIDGIRNLWNAMAGGHKVATYLLGILFFSAEDTRSLGMQLLNKLEAGKSAESGLRVIKSCRREAAMMLTGMTWKKLLPCQRDMQCMNHCGKTVKIVDPWLDETIESFCGPVCRWKHEYNRFIEISFNL